MKDINEFINEQLVTEASTQWKTRIEGSTITPDCDICNCSFGGRKKYGFICYDTDTETTSLIAVDNAEAFADAISIDVEEIEDMFKLSIGDSDTKDGCITTRIW